MASTHFAGAGYAESKRIKTADEIIQEYEAIYEEPLTLCGLKAHPYIHRQVYERVDLLTCRKCLTILVCQGNEQAKARLTYLQNRKGSKESRKAKKSLIS